MKLVAYLRVSTTSQAEEGYGLAVQEMAVRSWARANGHTVALWCRDEGVSGTKEAHERPGLAEALRLVRDVQVAGLVVHRLDRLARQLTVSEATLALVWKYGGTVYAVDVGEVRQDSIDDPMVAFVRQVLSAAAQMERGLVVSRMRAGRLHKAAEGGYAHGAPPYGRRAESGALVTDEDEARALALMRRLRAEGQSLRQIADALHEEGHRPKRGDVWHSAVVGRILSRSP